MTRDDSTKNQADLLVSLATRDEVEIELFHDELGDGYARVFRGPGWRVLKLHSQDFKRWLARKFWDEHGKTPNSESMSSALAVLEGKALFEGQRHELSNRIARIGDAIYYDLANEDDEAVVINKQGFSIISAPVLFRSHKHQKSQVKPAAERNVKRLLEFTNLKDESQALLLLVYVVAAFIPDIPRPIIHAFGDQGAAKTTLIRLVKRLVDPSHNETLSLAGGETQLVQKLSHHYMPCFDNISHLRAGLSDCLCRAVTGEGHTKRQLYTDDDDIIYVFKRCVGINGINIAARRPDLLDRCVLIELERIPPGRIREEAEFWQEFEQAKPAILAGIFEMLSCAITLYPRVKPATLFRMADFTHWGVAIASALGHSEGEFLEAYGSNLARQNEEALAGSNVASAVLSFMADRDSWQGTASQLLYQLDEVADQLRINTKQRGWPKAPNALSRRINEVKTNLAGGGISVDYLVTASGRQCLLSKNAENTVNTVVSKETPAKTYDGIHNGFILKPSIPSAIPSSELLMFHDDTRDDSDDDRSISS